MAYFIGTLIVPTIYGVITGLAWAFALSKTLLTGCYYGAFVGLIVGITFYLMGKAANFRGNVPQKQATILSGGMIATIFALSLFCALCTWIVRLIFF